MSRGVLVRSNELREVNIINHACMHTCIIKLLLVGIHMRVVELLISL